MSLLVHLAKRHFLSLCSMRSESAVAEHKTVSSFVPNILIP